MASFESISGFDKFSVFFSFISMLSTEKCLFSFMSFISLSLLIKIFSAVGLRALRLVRFESLGPLIHVSPAEFIINTLAFLLELALF